MILIKFIGLPFFIISRNFHEHNKIFHSSINKSLHFFHIKITFRNYTAIFTRFQELFQYLKKIDTRKTETYSAYPNSFWNILNTIDIVIIGSIWKLPTENEVDTPKNVIGKLLMAGIVIS